MTYDGRSRKVVMVCRVPVPATDEDANLRVKVSRYSRREKRKWSKAAHSLVAFREGRR